MNIAFVNRKVSAKTLLQRNEGFGAGNFNDRLYMLHNHLFQVFVILGIHLNKKGVLARNMMTFNNLGDLFDLLKNLFVR